jgi:hypothetical protein
MKKCWFCLCIIFCFHAPVRAQEDIQAMLKQIALLAVYVKELGNAIDIARDGLTTISEIKNGEFNLHSLFFNSLQRVNPSVAKYSKIEEIIADQLAIVSNFKNLTKRMTSSGRMTASEMSYISSVYDHISNECTKSLNDLISVTTDGKLEMTDDERVKRIDGIWTGMKDKYAFTQDFTTCTDQLSNERDREFRENKFLKTLE